MHPKNSKPFTIPTTYPFKEELRLFQAQHRAGIRTESAVVNDTTITLETEVMLNLAPVTLYSKVFKNRRVLDLSPFACKILCHMCIMLGHQDYTIRLTAAEVGMNKRTYAKAMLELTHMNVLRQVKGTRATYWVNLAMIANGDARSAKVDDEGDQ